MTTNRPFIRILTAINEYFLIALFVATIFILSLQVFSRTFLSTAFPWVEEVSRYFFVYFVFGGAALAFNRGVFISVDLVGRVIPGNARYVLDLLIDVIILVFFSAISILGVHLFIVSKGQLTPALEMEIRYVYLAFPLFFLQMSWFALRRLVTHLKSRR